MQFFIVFSFFVIKHYNLSVLTLACYMSMLCHLKRENYIFHLSVMVDTIQRSLQRCHQVIFNWPTFFLKRITVILYYPTTNYNVK